MQVAMSKRTYWTQEQIDEFTAWHETRMNELGYSEIIQRELRASRIKFLSGLLA